jgi:hypothetical protein
METDQKIIVMEEELIECKINLNKVLEELQNMEEEMKEIMLENERMMDITKDARKAIFKADKNCKKKLRRWAGC